MLKRVRLQGFGCFAALTFDLSGEPIAIRFDGSGNLAPLRKTTIKLSEYNQRFLGISMSGEVPAYEIVPTVCTIGAMHLVSLPHDQWAQVVVLKDSPQVSE